MNSNNNLFIASTSRTGSTLLAECLIQSEKIISLGELMYWSLRYDEKNILCTCGQINCSLLNNIKNAIDIKDTDIILYYWQLYENKIFGKYKNQELYEKKVVKSDIIDSYNNIIQAYQNIFGNDVSFVDNTKNIDIMTDLVAKKSMLFKYLILIRNPYGIINSYINSGKRKNIVRDVTSKINEIIYFYEKGLELMDNNDKNIYLLKYEDFISNHEEIIKRIYNFLGYQNKIGIGNNFKTKSHLIKGNHFMYEKNELSIAKEDNSWEFQLPISVIEEISKNKKLLSLMNIYGYNHY